MDPTLAALDVFEDFEALVEPQEHSEFTFAISHRAPTRITEDDVELIEEDAEDECSEPPSTKTPKGKARINDITSNLPSPPNFDNVFLHTQTEHKAYARLPLALRLDGTLSPKNIFTLFFSDSVLTHLLRIPMHMQVRWQQG